MTAQSEFESFMKNHQDMVYSVALRLLGRDADALDISQEVFLRAYERFDQLRHSDTARGWLRTVARNLSLNHLSRYRARWTFFSEMFTAREEPLEFQIPAADVHGDQTDGDHTRAVIEEALRSLPSAQRIPLVLYHFEEMSYEEIASRLGVSLSKVKVNIHRARERLRARIEQVTAQFEPGARPRQSVPLIQLP